MKWDLDGGDGDQHRIEHHEGQWYGTENLFTDMPRGERSPYIANLIQHCLWLAPQYLQYKIKKL